MSRLILVILFVCLSACSLLPGPSSVARNEYKLQAVPCAEISKNSSDKMLLLQSTIASAPFNSKSIVFRRDNFTYGKYQLSNWSAPAAVQLSGIILQRIECGNLFKNVTSLSRSTRSDYVLYTELLDFSHDVSVDPSVASIRLRAELVDQSERSVVASRTFEATAEATEVNVQGAVAAFDIGTQAISEFILGWLEALLKKS